MAATSKRGLGSAHNLQILNPRSVGVGIHPACPESADTDESAVARTVWSHCTAVLDGNCQADHLFELQVAIEVFAAYGKQIASCEQ
jgi:hypothetical protein